MSIDWELHFPHVSLLAKPCVGLDNLALWSRAACCPLSLPPVLDLNLAGFLGTISFL